MKFNLSRESFSPLWLGLFESIFVFLIPLHGNNEEIDFFFGLMYSAGRLSASFKNPKEEKKVKTRQILMTNAISFGHVVSENCLKFSKWL